MTQTFKKVSWIGALTMLTWGCAEGDSDLIDLSESERLPFEQKIIGGQSEGGYPAVGMLVTPQNTPHCTGTVIAPGWVLTAAHCVQNGLNGFSFMLGPQLGDPTSTTFSVVSAHVHPDYDPDDNYRADIALAQIQGDVGVAALPVAESLSNLQGQSLTFVGYGVSDGQANSGAGLKRSVVLPVVSMTDLRIQSNSPGQSVCFGDSGGPALANINGQITVVGVASFVDSNTCDGSGYHIRPDVYLDYIQQTMGGAAPQPDPQNPQPDPSGDFCAENGWYGDGMFCDDNCPQPDPDCQQIPQDPQQVPGGDFCADNGWYGDGVCDDGCPQPDPDCQQQNPQPNPQPDPQPNPQQGLDKCEELGWYGDGVCDVSCPQPDPDCQQDPQDPQQSPQPDPCAGGGCNQNGGGSAAQICEEVVTHFGRQVEALCGLDMATFRVMFLAPVGGHCGAIARIRDVSALYQSCLPWISSVNSCGTLLWDAPPACQQQLLTF